MPTPSRRRHLFVELLGGFGDLLIALPAIQAWGRSAPDARLDVVTFSPGADLLRLDPLVHSATSVDRARPGEGVQRVLDQGRYDVAVTDTRHSGIPALLEASVPRALTDLWRDPPSDQRVGHRFLEILLEEGLISPGSAQPARIQLPEGPRRRMAALPRPLVALLPEAGTAVKAWPADRFLAVGEELERGAGATVVVPAGGAGEATARLVEEGIRPVPTPDILHLGALLSRADLVVGADTGPIHLASALGTPTLTVFGPTWAGRYGQPGGTRIQGLPGCPVRVPSDFTSQACWDGGCPLPHWDSCTECVEPEQVAALALQLLGAGHRARQGVSPPATVAPASAWT